MKYAKASQVTVALEPSGSGGAVVSVRDDGIGFDTGLPRLARHGLLGMRYRVEAEGGTMRLVSAPGEGTLIEATLPPPAPEPSADAADPATSANLAQPASAEA